MKIVDISFLQGGAVMAVTYRRRWWQFWRPEQWIEHYRGERIA